MSTGTIIAILILLLLFLWGIILEMIINIFSTPTSGTPRSVLNEISDIMKPKKGSTVADLGCGDGRVLRRLAMDYEIVGKGYDISPLRLYLARILSLFTKKKGKLVYDVSSIYHINLSGADYVFLHLNEKTLSKLEKHLKTLEKGSYLFSYKYPLSKRATRKYELSNGEVLFRYKY